MNSRCYILVLLYQKERDSSIQNQKEAENGQKKPEKGGVRCEISVKFKTERLTSFRYSVIIPRENKAEHHRSHRLAVVETVNIPCFVPVCENRCGNWWKRGRMMRTFLKSTHFIFV